MTVTPEQGDELQRLTAEKDLLLELAAHSRTMQDEYRGMVESLIDERAALTAEVERLRGVLRRRQEPPTDEKLAALLVRAQRNCRSRPWREVGRLVRIIQGLRETAAEPDEFETRGGKSYLDSLMSLNPTPLTLDAIAKVKAEDAERRASN